MVQGWKRDVSSGVFVGDINKGRAPPVHDVVSEAFAGVHQRQLQKCFSARLKMLSQACY